MPQIRAIVSDVGGVLIDFDYTRFFAYLAHILNTRVSVARALWTDKDSPSALLYRFARGDFPLQGLWDGFEEKFGVRFTPEVEHDFRVLWMVGSEGLNAHTYQLLRSARADHGVRLVSCTNVDPIHGEELRGPGEPLHGFFDAEVQSWQVGALKPEPLMYACALEMAQAAPRECLFLDDQRENVEAARGLGMQAVHFTDAKSLAYDLAKLGLAPK